MEGYVKAVSKYLANICGITEANENEIIEYGIIQGLSLISNLFVFLLICIFINNLYQGLVFLISFWALRVYAGGYHAATRKKCFFLSMSIATFFLLAMKFISISRILLLLTLVVVVAIVCKLAPMENQNRPLDKKEVSVFRTRVRYIQVSEICVFFIAYCAGNVKVANAIIWAQILIVVLLVAEYAKHRTQKSMKKVNAI